MIYPANRELFDEARRIGKVSGALLKKFNSKKITLFELSPHKRIFLFFFTRSLKTYLAVCELCRLGFGQDVFSLLRNLLENLISMKYILHEASLADKKTVRFVEYKWVIFTRYLEAGSRSAASDPLVRKRDVILEKYKEYKTKYGISSDRALLTWSGKSVRDMAKKVSNKLLEEYETTFRFCSRFSHPSIVGDKEYIDYKEESLILSPFPSDVGIPQALFLGMKYMTNFMVLLDELFVLENTKNISGIKKNLQKIHDSILAGRDPAMEKSVASPGTPPGKKILLKFDLTNDI